MENQEKITDLVYKHLCNDLTPNEKIELDNWIDLSEENRIFFDQVSEPARVLKTLDKRTRYIESVDIEKAWEQFFALHLQEDQTAIRRRIISINWPKMVAAASILLIVFAGIYLLRKPEKEKVDKIVIPQVVQNDAKPHTRDAILTLDDGTTIILDSAKNGVLATQGETKVVKTANGQLIYAGSSITTDNSPLTFNTITVPRGSDVVFITLADGSKVWMNAASTIRYPVRFTGDTREVEVTGEAYFEVTRAKIGSGNKKPFIVSASGVKVEVLGTHFNVNAYGDESTIKTTLLEGSISVKIHEGARQSEKIIKPGEQAIAANGQLRVNAKIDIEQVMAWKNGKFFFDNTNIQDIMRQIERWYNLETVYRSSDLKRMDFDGTMSRYANASKVLAILEEASAGAIHFKIEGQKVILYKDDEASK